MAKILLIEHTDIVKFTAMNGNVDTDKFIQYALYAQDTHIETYLGTQLLKKIQELIETEDIDEVEFENYKNLLTDYIKPMLIHWAFAEYLPFSAYTIANKGVYKHTSENAQNVEKNEVDYLASKAVSMAQHYTDRFISHMSFYSNLFPEYDTNSNGDVYPNSNSNYLGWIL
jgi:hypothetical protein